MKSHEHPLFAEARDAKTAEELSAVIAKLETERSNLDSIQSDRRAQLEEAVVPGKDRARLRADVNRYAEDCQDFEAAIAGFTRKRDEMAQDEDRAELEQLRSRQTNTSAELTSAVEQMVKVINQAREACRAVAAKVDTLGRQQSALEAGGIRSLRPPSAIIRSTIGNVPRADGKTEYGRRLDVLLLEILRDNPGIQRRHERLTLGRPGETRAARTQIVAASQVINLG